MIITNFLNKKIIKQPKKTNNRSSNQENILKEFKWRLVAITLR